MSTPDESRERPHLEGLECGAGCTEIWEHLAEQRRDDADSDSDD